jgi:hypothetical protein
MWKSIRRIYTFVLINAVVSIAHIEAFQSSIPYLGWLTISFHVWILSIVVGLHLFVGFFFANVLLVIGHIHLFQSPYPYFAWLTVAAHIFLLLFILTKSLKKQGNESD